MTFVFLQKHAEAEESQRRLDNTRVDADEVIQGIINQQDFQADEMSGGESRRSFSLIYNLEKIL